ncbi:hypothetical protein [Nocardioides sp. GXQ0305]|uniref:hypothetical protein n=1 Tax=Nocardioides sp. GXQ0305 TaxID=3423912 RepID=UPI003D7D50B7
MDELETRLSDGLAGTAERAPAPADLAAGARDRLRLRRRTTAAVVAAAVAVVAVPVGVALVVPGDDGPAGDDEPTTGGVPTDWRTETWRDLSLDVPSDWGWGGGSDWCTSGREVEDTDPQVSRPGGVIPAIACSPSYGYGAHFLEPSGGELPPGTEGVVQQYRGGRYPDGAWIGYASTGQAAVWVVADDRTTARLVLDSTEPVGEVDANGCATRVEMTAPSTSARVSVCRYDDDGWLEQSELLSESESGRAVAAVAAAPQSGTAARHCTWEQAFEKPAIILRSAGFEATVLLEGCGVVDPAGGVVPRRLTPDVLYWALSPGWSGAVSGDVPVPQELRGQ